jgi:RHS repeat-associated protein
MHASWEYDGGELVGYAFDAGDVRRSAQLTRDPIGRIVAAVTSGAEQRFAYDAAGQLVRAGDLRFEYDAGGRLVRERGPAGTIGYEHDAAGQLVARRTDGGDPTTYEYDRSGLRVRASGDDLDRRYRWDSLGRLVAIEDRDGVTSTSVDALGELADVDGTALLWDTTGFSPPAWVGDRAVIGRDAPWATATAGDAGWLAPDWQGTVGGPRDPFGAPLAPGDPTPRLGYRGELEFAGETWLRARLYEPDTRSFLQPDPLPAVPGTASASNPYHYAANNPIGLADPSGLRPVTDHELRELRDKMGQNFVQRNADVIVAGALVVGGIAVMATGVGGPIGAAMIGGALLSAGASAGIQKVTTGSVNYRDVAIAGIAGAAGGGVGAWASGARALATASPLLRGAVVGGASSGAEGAVDRGLHGRNPFDPAGMGRDLLLGGGAGAVAGHLGDKLDPRANVVDDGPARTPADLHAFGNREMPRPPRPGQDFGVDDAGQVIPESPPLPRGASTFGDPHQSGLTGQYHRLPEGTELPPGLNVVADGSDVIPNSPHPPTHHTIYPTESMSPEAFSQAFSDLPWEHAGKIK